MSDFVVSARKYRPSTFESVVGQQALTTTLKNAIATNKLSHAYLFCGPRGVGKTSCARIFAKTINCQNRTPQGEACNECESCVAANEQRSYNIMELDAASNNSVNDIRQLIEQVHIAPTQGKYRVYIIDEVHMLSSSAFNAFLKTLEEPPAHAIFILATTEKHKVLTTIISRCQVHDFARITSNDIALHLQRIADAEGINAEPEALHMIGIAADGGMRDALSMFDQIAGFGGGQITTAGVRQNLNLLDEDEYFRLLAYVIEGSHTKTLTLIDELLARGYEGDIIIRGFSGFLRNVLMAQAPDTLHLIEAPHSVKDRMQKAGAYTPPYMLWEFLKISSSFGAKYKSSNDKRLALEVALMQMCEKGRNSPLQAPQTPQPTQPTAVQQPNNQVSQPQQARAKMPVTRPVATAPAPEPQKPSSNAAQSLYGFNLNTGKRAIDKDEPKRVAKLDRDEDYTEEDLINTWLSFATKQTNGMVKAALSAQLPSKNPNHTQTVIANSKSLEGQLHMLLPELTQLLRDTLKNDKIRLEVELRLEEQKSGPRTPQEKFEFLSKNNPWFNSFAKDLELSPRG